MSNRQPSRLQFGACRLNAIVGSLALKPAGEFPESVVHLHLRLVSEQAPSQTDVGKAVANISHAILSRDFHSSLRLADGAGDAVGNFKNGDRLSAADVHRATCGVGNLQGESTCLDNIVDAHKVPSLPPVFENDGR